MLLKKVHHTYRSGRATDTSGNGNHGIPTDTGESDVDDTTSLFFNGVSARVVIPPTEDFADINGVRIKVRVKLSRWWWFFWWPWIVLHRWWPAKWKWRWWPWWRFRFRRRHNLVEGHLSFALFVRRDLSVQGTIRGPAGWDGPVSAPGALRTGRWHTVEFGHDGINRAALAVDGVTVAESREIAGPIPDVGPNGIVVGHWPEPDHRYSLRGWVDELEVWTDVDIPEKVSDCCGDSDIVDEAGVALTNDSQDAWDQQRADALIQEIERVETELRIAVIQGDATTGAQLDALSATGAAALRSGDKVAGMSALAGTLQLTGNRLNASDLETALNRALVVAQKLPLEKELLAVAAGDESARRLLRHLTTAFCLPDVRLPDGERAKGVRRDPDVHTGDPDTDEEPTPPGDPEEALRTSNQQTPPSEERDDHDDRDERDR